MQSFILAAYGILLFASFFAVVFVVFHLFRYSLSRTSAWVASGIFLLTAGFLIAANIALFFSIQWDSVLTGLLGTTL